MSSGSHEYPSSSKGAALLWPLSGWEKGFSLLPSPAAAVVSFFSLSCIFKAILIVASRRPQYIEPQLGCIKRRIRFPFFPCCEAPWLRAICCSCFMLLTHCRDGTAAWAAGNVYFRNGACIVLFRSKDSECVWSLVSPGLSLEHPLFLALFQSRLLGRLNCPQTSWGFEGKCANICELGVAASVAWGLSCGHRLPLGSDNSLAKLQLSAWDSAQPWNGYLQQGRTFSPLGRWSARTQIACCTPGVLQQRLYWKGKEKKNKRGHEFSWAAAFHIPPSSKGLLCQPLQGAEPFLQVFLLYFPCSLKF